MPAAAKKEIERTTEADYYPALHTLLTIYAQRKDLQADYPEAFNWDFRRLIAWAHAVSRGAREDGDRERLRPHVDWYRENTFDAKGSARLARELISDASAKSANPMPLALERMHSEASRDIREHFTTLSLLVTEFNIKTALELGTRDGGSTIVLLEALQRIHGHLWSVDIEPCMRAHEAVERAGLAGYWTFIRANSLSFDERAIPRALDLLLIDTFHLYSQTRDELKKTAQLVRKGGWIALHDSVSFPGVSKAALEFIDSLDSKPRFYPYLNNNGLNLLKIM